MTELKTLKDLEICTDEGDLIIIPNNLRQEAINWIKEGLSHFKFEGGDRHTDQIEEWIKYFFNITEEDL